MCTLLWKVRPVAQWGLDEHPAVSTLCQALIKTCGNFAGTVDPVKLSLLSLNYTTMLRLIICILISSDLLEFPFNYSYRIRKCYVIITYKGQKNLKMFTCPADKYT